MTRILCADFAVLMMATMLVTVGCGKRVYYSNVLGQYTIAQAYEQYAELFQVKQSQCKEFRTCEAGWWKTDVKKIREMGINVTDLCERYCRVTHIKVPFPLLVDYDLLCRSG